MRLTQEFGSNLQDGLQLKEVERIRWVLVEIQYLSSESIFYQFVVYFPIILASYFSEQIW